MKFISWCVHIAGRIILGLLISSGSLFIAAQDPITIFEAKGKCGYKNANGVIIVPAKYDNCRDCEFLFSIILIT